MPHIHLLCGNTASGKTTYASALANEQNAVRLIIDDWMKTLYLDAAPEQIDYDWNLRHITKCEEMMWKVAEEILRSGRNVIMEISTSTRADRSKQYDMASKIGFPYMLHYLDIPEEIRWKRLLERNQQKNDTYSFDVDEQSFNFMNKLFEAPNDNELLSAITIKE